VEWGVEHRDVNGEISADVHSSMLNCRDVRFGDDPKEKFSLNMLARNTIEPVWVGVCLVRRESGRETVRDPAIASI